MRRVIYQKENEGWRRKWQPTPVFLPGKFQGQRSLVGYIPWDRKESDMTEQLILSLFTFMENREYLKADLRVK